MIDFEAMNADPPPEWVEAHDVDTQPAGGQAEALAWREEGWTARVLTYTHLRPDGQMLTYRRWTDDDGDRFYREDVLRDRLATANA